MASYFEEEDATYNSDDTKSVNSDEDKIYSKKKVGTSIKDSLKAKKQNDLNIHINNDDIEEAEEEEEDDDVDEDVDDDDLDDEEDLDEEEPFEQEGGLDTKKKTNIPLFDYEHQVDDNDNNNEDIDEDDDDDDDDNNEQYIKKFDKELNQRFLQQTHPECIIQNYDEIETLCKVVRNKQGIIVDVLHKTNPYLTKYEKTKILGLRAKQLNAGAIPFVDIPEKVIDGYTIAELELKGQKIPFIIRRPLPCGASEYWYLNDLEDISF
jgi:DNA-directed RNA polymerase subunit K/omega